MAYANRKYARRNLGRRKFKRKMRKMAPFRTRVRRAVQSFAEKKSHIEEFDDDMHWDGTVTSLVDIAQGTDVNKRIGDQIQITGVLFHAGIKGKLANDSSAVCLMLIQDLQQASDAIPTPASILHATGNNRAPYSPLSAIHKGRYKVLWRHNTVVSGIGDGADIVSIKRYLKLNVRVRYNGTTSSDYQKNALYLLAISDYDDTGEPTTMPTLRGWCRVYYTDI